MRKTFLIAILAVCLLAMTGQVWAADNASCTATVKIEGLGIQVSQPANLDLGTVDFGTTQASASGHVVGINNRGENGAWYLTVSNTAFTGTGGAIPANNFVYSTETSKFEKDGVAGNVGIINNHSNQAIGTTGIALVELGSGVALGAHTFTSGTYKLIIPADQPEGTYTATMTYTAIVGTPE
jgi:hypothetical protein